MSIMVDGKMMCIGDKTHLKNKFGSGFEMVVRLDRSSRTAAFEAFMAAQMGHAKLEEKRGTKYTYALPPDTRLSRAFATVERIRGELGITDYCISQTSLEQVFLRISEAEADGEMLAANAGSPQTPQPTTPQAASLAP